MRATKHAAASVSAAPPGDRRRLTKSRPMSQAAAMPPGRPAPPVVRNPLAARATRQSSLPGGIAARRHGLRSASAEAALGFPVLFETALPAMRAAAAQGRARHEVLLDTLFHVMAVLDDSNLAHRGGLEGLRQAQNAARGFIAAGGAARPDGVAAALEIGRAFVSHRLSPGGAADTLAAACLVARIGSRQVS